MVGVIQKLSKTARVVQLQYASVFDIDRRPNPAVKRSTSNPMLVQSGFNPARRSDFLIYYVIMILQFISYCLKLKFFKHL